MPSRLRSIPMALHKNQAFQMCGVLRDIRKTIAAGCAVDLMDEFSQRFGSCRRNRL